MAKTTKKVSAGSPMYKNYLENREALNVVLSSKYTTKKDVTKIYDYIAKEGNYRLYKAYERKYIKGEDVGDITEFRGAKSRIGESGYRPFTSDNKTKGQMKRDITKMLEFLQKKTSTTKGYEEDALERNRRIREKIAEGLYGDESEQSRVKITKQQYKDIGKLLDRMKAANIISDAKGVSGGIVGSDDILQKALQYAYENKNITTVDSWFDYANKLYTTSKKAKYKQYTMNQSDFEALWGI